MQQEQLAGTYDAMFYAGAFLLASFFAYLVFLARNVRGDWSSLLAAASVCGGFASAGIGVVAAKSGATAGSEPYYVGGAVIAGMVIAFVGARRVSYFLMSKITGMPSEQLEALENLEADSGIMDRGDSAGDRRGTRGDGHLDQLGDPGRTENGGTG